MTTATNQPRVVGIIPARWGSTRFPGKPLHPIAGKPLIQHVWERCLQSTKLNAVAVATDDDRIATAARGFGAEVTMTSPDHPSGTDRCEEALRSLGETATHAINIQGDEPLIDPTLIDRLADALTGDPTLQMVTAASPTGDPATTANSDVVKVVCNTAGDALYFSRAPIPFSREDPTPPQSLRHQGIYGFRANFLTRFVNLPPSPLELAEGLEQLRALEAGTRIRVLVTKDSAIGVDTPASVAIVEQLLLDTST